MLMVVRRVICSDDYDWYLETQVEVAKETEPEPAKAIQMDLPGLTPGVSFEIESFRGGLDTRIQALRAKSFGLAISTKLNARSKHARPVLA
ncbi:hypothetical protein Pla52n_01470 [Stieleria varia]|uniref:Uncharacterized protein n=1 Tax=Stieleria varia TaxID=2528005 RepID=A0A5C6BAP5_9BACT|nr:hypothetical protein Pla52n_01470 [Stieleria varia]